MYNRPNILARLIHLHTRTKGYTRRCSCTRHMRVHAHSRVRLMQVHVNLRILSLQVPVVGEWDVASEWYRMYVSMYVCNYYYLSCIILNVNFQIFQILLHLYGTAQLQGKTCVARSQCCQVLC